MRSRKNNYVVIVSDIALVRGIPADVIRRSYCAWRLYFSKLYMITDSHDIDQLIPQRSMPAWAEVWHLWTVIIPRRSITGRLLYGKVWRRHDGRHWIYKRFVEYTYEHPK